MKRINNKKSLSEDVGESRTNATRNERNIDNSDEGVSWDGGGVAHEAGTGKADNSSTKNLRVLGRNNRASSGSKRSRKENKEADGGSDKKRQRQQGGMEDEDDPEAATMQDVQHYLDNDGAADESTVDSLIQRIRCYFSDDDPTEAPIDEAQARRLLEFSSGDVDVAAGFYWDEYFATTASADRKKNQSKKNHRMENRPDSGQKGWAIAGSGPSGREEEEPEDYEEEDDGDNIQPRRLDVELNVYDRRRNNAPNDDEQEGGRAEDVEVGDIDDDDNEETGDNINGQGPRPGNAVEPQNIGGSVSISDDEAAMDESSRRNRAARRGGGASRRTRQRPSAAGSNVRRAFIVPEEDKPFSVCLDQTELAERGEATATESVDPLDNGFLDNHDWILQTSSTLVPLDFDKEPSRVLWLGKLISSGISRQDAAPEQSSSIPYAWINAGFAMSECGTGVVAKPPCDEEISFFRWQQQQEEGRSNIRFAVLPPYHSRGVTLLLSIVTGLMYSGANIQGREVDCTRSRKPFAELSEAERKREFESRLVDALAALIHVAVTKSTERKKKALSRRSQSNVSEDEKLSNEQKIRRRLLLFPSCRWETSTSDGMLQDDVEAGKNARIQTSLTAIDDIKTYVLSNIRAFTSRGGVALFLETIFRIHGKGAVMSMLEKTEEKSSVPSRERKLGLIRCVCERDFRLSADKYEAVRKTKDVLDTGNPTHTCVSCELLSFLLIGEIRSSMKGWSTAGLGIGILAGKQEQRPDPRLLKPREPVWLIQGEKYYSTLWLDLKRIAPETIPSRIAKEDIPGSTNYMIHWNSWFGIQRKTSLRIMVPSSEWKPPTAKSGVAASRDLHQMRVLHNTLQKRREALRELSLDEQEDTVLHKSFSKGFWDQVAKVREHEEDSKFYPDNYHMWRFNLSEITQTEDASVGDRKPAGWIPYYKLTPHQKMIVDRKMSPSICQLLWCRWPTASIDQFDTQSPPHV